MAIVVLIPATMGMAKPASERLVVQSVCRTGPDYQLESYTVTDHLITFRCMETGRLYSMVAPFCWDGDAWLPQYATFPPNFMHDNRRAAIHQLRDLAPANDLMAIKPALN